MRRRKYKKRIVTLLMLSAITGGFAVWGYWHFIEAPKYQFVSNATRL